MKRRGGDAADSSANIGGGNAGEAGGKRAFGSDVSRTAAEAPEPGHLDDLEFEDEFADDFDEEIVGRVHGDRETDGDTDLARGGADGVASSDESLDDDDSDDSGEESSRPRGVFRPGLDTLEEGEILDYDAGAYQMLHRMNVEWPCLSFDFFPDSLGAQRTRFPMTCYVVAGTQADSTQNNKLMLIKASQMHRTKHDEDTDGAINLDGDDSDDDLDDDAELDTRSLPHPGAVNRVRVSPLGDNHIVATWSDLGKVCLWDVSRHIAALDAPPTQRLPNAISPIAELTRHSTEGFALEWSPHTAGRLVSGDCAGGLYLTELKDGVSWIQGSRPFRGHTDSVEDLAWSPSEEQVFASCSVDGTVKIWDCRMRKAAGRSFVASDVDVNVISWNRTREYLLASGADDGSFEVWDLRSLSSTSQQPNSTGNIKCDSVSRFHWHTDQITSISWDPNDESVVAVAGADDQVTIWDLSVEEDPDEVRARGSETGDLHDVPAQLMFVHQGQKIIKEVRWHPQIPLMLMTTASDSFNIFMPDIVAGREPLEGADETGKAEATQ